MNRLIIVLLALGICLGGVGCPADDDDDDDEEDDEEEDK